MWAVAMSKYGLTPGTPELTSTGPIVFGLEAQGDWADLRGQNPSLLPPPYPPSINRTRVDADGLMVQLLIGMV